MRIEEDGNFRMKVFLEQEVGKLKPDELKIKSKN
jgi:hypothetical protein